MFGTIMKARLKDGKTLDDLRDVMGPWSAEAESQGALRLELGVAADDSQVVVGVVHFRDRESYYANAGRTETNAQYERMLEVLDGPPEWTDIAWKATYGSPQQAAAV